jgi:hypothetical protein
MGDPNNWIGHLTVDRAEGPETETQSQDGLTGPEPDIETQSQNGGPCPYPFPPGGGGWPAQKQPPDFLAPQNFGPPAPGMSTKIFGRSWLAALAHPPHTPINRLGGPRSPDLHPTQPPPCTARPNRSRTPPRPIRDARLPTPHPPQIFFIPPPPSAIYRTSTKMFYIGALKIHSQTPPNSLIPQGFQGFHHD